MASFWVCLCLNHFFSNDLALTNPLERVCFLVNSLCQCKLSLFVALSELCRKSRRQIMSYNPEKKCPGRSHLNTFLEKPQNTRYSFTSNNVKISERCSQHTCGRLGWTTSESQSTWPLLKWHSFFWRATILKQQWG